MESGDLIVFSFFSFFNLASWFSREASSNGEAGRILEGDICFLLKEDLGTVSLLRQS